MNKKAGDKIIAVYWFTVLFIVAAAIVYMVAIFYGDPIDIRQTEAEILTAKVAECFSQAGDLKKSVFSEGEFIINKKNFLQICNLNFNVEEFKGWGDEQYYVLVEIFDFDTDNYQPKISVGNSNLIDNCGESKNFPQCTNKSLYVIDKKTNHQYKINIFSSVRKTEKNAK